MVRIEGRLAARYRFRHVLFQRYLYDRLDAAERIRLHEATGRGLEGLYADHPDAPVIDLAKHFDEAGIEDSAIHYLHLAGQRAVQMAAAAEAIGLLERARVLLPALQESTDRDQREVAILASLLAALMAARGYAAPEAEPVGERVEELCARLAPSPTTAVALTGRASVLSVQSRYARALETCRKASAISDALEIPALSVLNHHMLGMNQTWMGDLELGHASFRRAEELYDPIEHAWLIHSFGSAAGPEAYVWDAVNTLLRGFPEQAHTLADQGIALARQLGHPFTLCHTLAAGGAVLRLYSGDYRGAEPFADEVEAIARIEHFPFYEIAATLYRSQAAGHLGDPEAGIEGVTRGLEAWRAINIEAYRSVFLGHVAEFESRIGNTGQGLDVIAGALRATQDSGEALAEADLMVKRGSILVAHGDHDAALEALQDATHRAQSIGARLFALQAATALAVLHAGSGNAAAAKEVLAPAYSWFTEGFGNRHLRDARAVLERL